MYTTYYIIATLYLFCLSRQNIALQLSQKLNDPRIIGGYEVKPHSIPYQVFLNVTGTDNSTWVCGGSLISLNYVLTAARCCYGASSVTVVVGAHDLLNEDIYQVTLESTNYTIYPRFTTNVTNFIYVEDIAVVALPKPIKPNKFVTTVKLPNPYEDNTFANNIGTISGWGITDGYNDTSFSTVLLAQKTRILNNMECMNTYFDLSVSSLCVATNETDSPCVGDYGSPLTVDGIQVGVASQGVDHCGSFIDSPYIYTRVSTFIRWIKSETDYEDDYTTTSTKIPETTPTVATTTVETQSTITSNIDTTTDIIDTTTDIIGTTTGKAFRAYCLVPMLVLSFVVMNF